MGEIFFSFNHSFIFGKRISIVIFVFGVTHISSKRNNICSNFFRIVFLGPPCQIYAKVKNLSICVRPFINIINVTNSILMSYSQISTDFFIVQKCLTYLIDCSWIIIIFFIYSNFIGRACPIFTYCKLLICRHLGIVLRYYPLKISIDCIWSFVSESSLNGRVRTNNGLLEVIQFALTLHMAIKVKLFTKIIYKSSKE